MLRASVLAIAFCGLSACAPDARVPQKPATASLFFSTTEIAPGRIFPSPLVRGSVNGQPTIFIVDTGAQVSVVDEHVATEAKLDFKGGARAVDPSGSSVALSKTAAPHIAIDGLGPLPDRPTAVIALPQVLTSLGVGAILSPQMIPKDGRFVVLDLPNRELRLDDGAAAASVSKKVFDLGAITVCRYDDNGFKAASLVLSAMIDGVPTRLELDTGASATSVVAQSPVGDKLASHLEVDHKKAVGAVGEIDIAKVANISIMIGEVDASGFLMMIPGAKSDNCQYEGRVGIDHLRPCTFLIGETSARATCAAPAF